MQKLSKTFSLPLTENDFQNPELLNTMEEVYQRQQQYIQQKLMRQEQIENRLKRLQRQYEQFTNNKESKIKYKLQKSQKNRIQYIDKIVKRCKLKEKMYNQKMKNVNIKKRQSLRQAWRQATEFNQKIHDQNSNSNLNKNSRGKSLDQHKIHNKTFQATHIQIPGDNGNLNGPQNLTKSVMFSDEVIEGNNNKFNQQNPSMVGVKSPVQASAFKNHSKAQQQLSASKNFMKASDHHIFQSTFNIQKKSSRFPKAINTSSQRVLQSIQSRQSKHLNIPSTNKNTDSVQNFMMEQFQANQYQQKLRKTLIRHKEHLLEEQNKKIQQYGQRLQKINISRRKKDSLKKQKLKRNSSDKEMDYYGGESNMNEHKSNPFLTKKEKERMKSQNNAYERSKRASDWSESNKQRRQQMLQAHIQQGNQYLSENRIRHLKQVVSRNLAYNAIQKKLFKERFRHAA